ncbi:MAG: outer membrane beta-barrel protein [Bacteroidota bacterium]|nr:outer membrane beta-barrel protein [Bacteroidota bacterium]
MDNKAYQDEFEQFLQDEVKQHRMYPSEHIWKNIRTELHGYRAWPALTFISLFIITALTISTLLNNHPDRHLTIPLVVQPISMKKTQAQPVSLIRVADKTAATSEYFQKIGPAQMTAATFAEVSPSLLPQEWVVDEPRTILAANTVKVRETGIKTENVKLSEQKIAPMIALPATVGVVENTLLSNSPLEENLEAENKSLPVTIQETQKEIPAEENLTADDFLKDFNYVTNKPIRRNSKFGFQVYITPSTSYRRLSDEKVKEIIQPAAQQATSAAQNVSLNPNISADVNNVVRHKPAFGLELGFAVLYNMTDRLKFKTGVQLNIRQYYIETFRSLTNDLTSLSLINNRGIETINFYSPFNNNIGYKKAQLDNKVYQLSIPLGVQWDIFQGKHLGLNTEASVQPTFTINNNTYLLSTDYKHYTDGADFIRKWNINTSVGLNLTYKTGIYSWQLGPQIRYQHLPTYSNVYPIKEFLMDYGIRLGFTRQIK